MGIYKVFIRFLFVYSVTIAFATTPSYGAAVILDDMRTAPSGLNWGIIYTAGQLAVKTRLNDTQSKAKYRTMQGVRSGGLLIRPPGISMSYNTGVAYSGLDPANALDSLGATAVTYYLELYTRYLRGTRTIDLKFGVYHLRAEVTLNVNGYASIELTGVQLAALKATLADESQQLLINWNYFAGRGTVLRKVQLSDALSASGVAYTPAVIAPAPVVTPEPRTLLLLFPTLFVVVGGRLRKARFGA